MSFFTHVTQRLFVALAGAAAFVCAPNIAAAPAQVRVGYVETAEPGYLTRTVLPVVHAIEKATPGTHVQLVGLSSITLTDVVRQSNPDFIISPAADFLRLLDTTGAHPIVTRKSSHAQSPTQSVGATIITQASREDITDLISLRGKRVASTLPTSIDGWLSVRMELEKNGLDSRNFFESVDFLNFSYPNVFVSILSGAYDAVAVPTCLLERAQDEGLIEKGLVKVINQKDDQTSTCAHSTDLYPDLIVSSSPRTDLDLVKAVTISLLSGSEQSPLYSWYVTSDFHALRNLEETLKIGPWSYLAEWTPSALWQRYKTGILTALALLAAFIFNEWRLRRLVVQRTQELTQTMNERDELAKSHARSRERISQMERLGTISQLCAMIAHELKQPVGAVLNYLAVIRLIEMNNQSDDAQPNPKLDKAMSGAETEARRIAQIIDRVRGYARKQSRQAVRCDLHEVISLAKKNVLVSLKTPVKIDLNLARHAYVMGEPLELELLFLNLMKNAAQAVDSIPDGLVSVTLRDTRKNIEVTVSDNGPYLDDESFKRLTRVSESVKEDGLGLGLGIVRNLVDENAGQMHVERLPIRGLCFTVTFDRADDAGKTTKECQQ